MKRILTLLVVACTIFVAACSEPVQDPNGYDTAEYSTTAVGSPIGSAKLARAADHARAFWCEHLGGAVCSRSCSRWPDYQNYSDPGLTHVAYAQNCFVIDDSPCAGCPPPCASAGNCGDGSKQGIITFNVNYRWTYKRLCVVVVHEMGHLNGISHNSSNFAVMDKTPYIGEGGCPT